MIVIPQLRGYIRSNIKPLAIRHPSVDRKVVLGDRALINPDGISNILTKVN